MGNSESNANPIRNMDKRTARREYREAFIAAISRYRSVNVSHSNDEDMSKHPWSGGDIRVCVRKRPIHKRELDAFEFDVVSSSGNKVIVHDARMHIDMKRQFINHHEFEFDKVFGDSADNEKVYQESVRSLVDIAIDGGFGTALVYGQTGSGKTFTMTSVIQKATRDIFSVLEKVTSRFEQTPPTVSLCFFEIAGDNCLDLLNGFQPTQLLTGTDGGVYAYPVVEPTVSSVEELLSMIDHGTAIRSTAATGVHDGSSRSHAILRIYIQRNDLPSRDGLPSSQAMSPEGVLTLVDLAGSEHRIDSMHHGKERRKECGSINASLMALKDCIRARAAGSNVSHQYRRSKLTMALKASFSLRTARTMVIATVAPASKDTEHSLNTLRHANIMGEKSANKDGTGKDHKESSSSPFVTGGRVRTEQVGEVNITEIARKNIQIKRAGGVMDGPKNSNGNVVHGGAAKAANKEDEVTEKQKAKQKRQAESRSLAKMDPNHKALLMSFRAQLGNDKRQVYRQRRPPSLEEDMDNSDSTDREQMGAGDKNNNGEGLGLDSLLEGDEDEDEDEIEAPLTKNRSEGKSPDHAYAHADAHAQGSRPAAEGAVSEDTVKVAAVDSRIPFEKLYASIYLSQSSAMAVPEDILQRQLSACMKLHGYTPEEIAHHLLQTRQHAPEFEGKLKRGPVAETNISYNSINEKQQHTQASSPPQRENGLLGAREKLERQAAIRKSRQEAARAHVREQQGEDQGQGDWNDAGGQRKEMESLLERDRQRTKEKEREMEWLKEKNKAQALTDAAAKLERDAAVRKSRQDAARALLQEKRQPRRGGNNSHSTADSNSSDGKIAFHEKEIMRLTAELEGVLVDGVPSPTPKGKAGALSHSPRGSNVPSTRSPISAASLHGIKKNIATHKAAILREKREKGKQSTIDDASDIGITEDASRSTHTDDNPADNPNTRNVTGQHSRRIARNRSRFAGIHQSVDTDSPSFAPVGKERDHDGSTTSNDRLPIHRRRHDHDQGHDHGQLVDDKATLSHSRSQPLTARGPVEESNYTFNHGHSNEGEPSLRDGGGGGKGRRRHSFEQEQQQQQQLHDNDHDNDHHRRGDRIIPNRQQVETGRDPIRNDPVKDRYKDWATKDWDNVRDRMEGAMNKPDTGVVVVKPLTKLQRYHLEAHQQLQNEKEHIPNVSNRNSTNGRARYGSPPQAPQAPVMQALAPEPQDKQLQPEPYLSYAQIRARNQGLPYQGVVDSRATPATSAPFANEYSWDK